MVVFLIGKQIIDLKVLSAVAQRQIQTKCNAGSWMVCDHYTLKTFGSELTRIPGSASGLTHSLGQTDQKTCHIMSILLGLCASSLTLFCAMLTQFLGHTGSNRITWIMWTNLTTNRQPRRRIKILNAVHTHTSINRLNGPRAKQSSMSKSFQCSWAIFIYFNSSDKTIKQAQAVQGRSKANKNCHQKRCALPVRISKIF